MIFTLHSYNNYKITYIRAFSLGYIVLVLPTAKVITETTITSHLVCFPRGCKTAVRQILRHPFVTTRRFKETIYVWLRRYAISSDVSNWCWILALIGRMASEQAKCVQNVSGARSDFQRTSRGLLLVYKNCVTNGTFHTRRLGGSWRSCALKLSFS